MQFVEHGFRVDLEGGGEQVVQVDFVGLVDARNGNRASVTLLAGTRGRTLFLVFAVGLNGVAGLGCHVDHL